MANVETTSANPTLIVDQVANILIEPLQAASVVLASGPRIFDSSEPLRVPTLVGSSDPTFVAEGALIPDADVTFGEIKLMPSDRTSVKTILKMTSELVRQSHISLDAVMKARLVNDVAYKLDTAMLVGDGKDKSITGLVNQAGTQKAALDVTKADTFLDALALAAAAEVQPNRFFLNSADFFAVRKLKDASGKYLLESDVTKDTTYRLFGVPVTVTNKLPAGKAVLANMSEVAVVRDQSPTVKILDQRYAEFDQVGIRVTARYDLGLLRPQGVVVMSKAA